MRIQFCRAGSRPTGLLALCGLLATLCAGPASSCPIDPPSKDALEAALSQVARHGDEVPCVDGVAAGYPCNNIDLMSFLPLADIGGGGGADIWGWTDSSTGKEYALMARSNGTAFVDISDPDAPIYLGNLPTHTSNSSWRDIKTMRSYAVIVSEANSHGMQVFDLRQLRGLSGPPVTFTATAHYGEFGSAHNIVVNEDTGFGYAVGTQNGSDGCGGGLHMIDLSDPETPTFAGCFSGDGYTHDAQCVIYTGPDADYNTPGAPREICFAYNEDTLTIVDVTSKSAPAVIARRGYQGVGYTHQGWVTPDQEFLLLDDEGDERASGHNTRTYIWNIRDLDNPRQTQSYDSPVPSIDHNLYIKEGYAYEANYQSGLRILDVSELASGVISENSFFDIYPTGNAASFNGAWSVYPFFPSGNVIVSGIEQGLFVLRPTALGAAFTLSADATNLDFCGAGSGSVGIDIAARPGFTAPIALSVSGVPAGVTAALANQSVTPPAVTTLGLTVSAVLPGQYPITVSGDDGTDQFSTTVQLTASGDTPGTAQLTVPIDGAAGISAYQSLYWIPVADAFAYDVDVATDAAFSNIVASASGLGGTNFVPQTGLQNDTDYFWRVRARNACGATLSTTSQFRTAAQNCQVFAATDVPFNIDGNGTPTIVSNMTATAGGIVTDVDVINLNGLHTYVGDLQFRLEGPEQAGHDEDPVSRHPRRKTVTLIDRICASDDDFDLSLDDAAATLVPCPPTGGGTHLPASVLSEFNGVTGDGLWTLYVADNFPQDGGRLNGWGLRICSTPESLVPDSDGDGVEDALDNCLFDANPDQRDSNADGYGNLCDADLDNNGIVNVVDLGIMRTVFFSADADADLTGDGVVNSADLGRMRVQFFAAPGPSGVAQ